MSEQQTVLSVRGLRVSYRTGGRLVDAVRGIDFDVAAGEVVAIVGESGSGKSTTAHAVIHLLAPNAVVEATRIQLGSTDLAALAPREWREVRGRRIGLIPQDPSVSLNPVHRVGPQVGEVLRVHGLANRRQAEARAVALLEQAGIPDAATRARQFPHQFSGGMKQRALIAAALAATPQLVIADEPTSALDVTVQRQILDNIETLTRDSGTAVLLITHDLGVAGDRADRILVMHHGEIVEQGTAEQILTAPRHPYTRKLLAAAPGLSLQTAVRERPEPPALHASAAPLVAATALRKEFALPRSGRGARSLTAVDDVSFEIARGETFALVGESGSGKSTTARLVLRLETPSSGVIRFDGDDITRLRGEALRRARRRFQVVYQSPFSSLDPRFSIGEVIDEPLRAYGVGTRSTRSARVRELLDQVALPASYSDRRPHELSGGQRQRVAIARALALSPELVVLDEAVSALDVSVQAQILDLLTEVQRESGVSYLFISHDLAVVRQISHRVGVMQRGRLVEIGAASALLDAPVQEYTRELVAAIPGRRLGGVQTPATDPAAHPATPAPVIASSLKGTP
ncbi:ABC transporter ATP-binding protein [Herbiconiux sp. 11R-BC]|uniref:dipeptide ABC transporter ATP-binding protein n=1 Tax=Herbiconiux sp. 11R-BC TaxID=3111637 RepID=UPI003C0F46B6